LRENYKPSSDAHGGAKNCLYIKLSPRINNETFKAECEKFGETEYAYVIYEPYLLTQLEEAPTQTRFPEDMLSSDSR
jgi:hypothetical protein